MAVSESVPTGSLGVEKTATPAFSAADPTLLAPFLNVTVPVGVPGALLVTCAVSVTVSPNMDGFGADVSVVLDAVTPFPERAVNCGLPVALSLTLRLPIRFPNWAGWNWT